MQTNSWRYERKFLTHDPDSVRTMLSHHPEFFHEIYPPRRVNNVYLDTGGLRSLHDNLGGLRDRVKTRIRWYGDEKTLSVHPRLELKIKAGLVGRKRDFDLPPRPSEEGCSPAAVKAILDAAVLPDDVKLHLGSVRPTLMNHYWRRYYVSRDGRFRVTVDTDLGFCVPTTADWARGWTYRGVAIVELKYAVEDDPDSSRISQFFPFRTTRSSKYVFGIQTLYAGASA